MENQIPTLFPFAEYWWFYVGFNVFVIGLLLLDLGVFHKKAHEVSFKEAAIWTCVWVGLALVFNLFFYKYALWKFENSPQLLALPGFIPEAMAKQSALEFLTGFIVEKSLAIDNLFIFAVPSTYSAILSIFQHRILL